jgi:hypothetical protein
MDVLVPKNLSFNQFAYYAILTSILYMTLLIILAFAILDIYLRMDLVLKLVVMELILEWNVMMETFLIWMDAVLVVKYKNHMYAKDRIIKIQNALLILNHK